MYRRTKMKRKRFAEEQIIGILKEGESGMKASDLARSTSLKNYVHCRGVGIVQMAVN